MRISNKMHSRKVVRNCGCSDSNKENNLKLTRGSYFKDALIPTVTALIALFGVFSGFVLNSWSEKSQLNQKVFEVTFPEKQKSYAKLFSLLSEHFLASFDDSKSRFMATSVEIETTFFGIEPFISSKSRKEIWIEIQEFKYFCQGITFNKPKTDSEVTDVKEDFSKRRNKIREILFRDLFDKNDDSNIKLIKTEDPFF